MSAIATTAAHLVVLPVRYAVGRWNNVSTSTILAFNAIDIGLQLLIKSISAYVVKSRKLEIQRYQENALIMSIRLITRLIALTVTAKLTNPMPLNYAIATSFAAAISIAGAQTIADWMTGVE